MLCEICHERLKRPGFRTCWTCNGFPEREEEEQSMEEQQVITELGRCATCGIDFEPYRNGVCLVKNNICQPCLMRKKYGDDWVPGGNRENRLKVQKARRERRKKILKEKEAAPTAPVETEKEYAAQQIVSTVEYPAITIEFSSEDQALYERLKTIAKRERRTLEQQMLYYVEYALEDEG